MSDLVDTTEMYLKAILELEEENIVPLRARIAERLHHSGPTVSQTIARMERDGLVIVSEDRHLELTAQGKKVAVAVMRKHRLAERLLADVVKLEWPYVHEEACRWEHVMSDRVERRILALLEEPSYSPYGHPIPGLEALGAAEVPKAEVMDMVSALGARGDGSVVTVASISERIQVDPELLSQLFEAGIVPGAQVEVERLGDYISVHAPGSLGLLELPQEVAVHIFVH